MKRRPGIGLRSGVGLGLVLLTLFTYWPVGHHEFINYDDNRYVSDNPRVQTGLSGAGLRWALTATAAGNWHPLTWASHMLDVTLFGMHPGRHHLVNLLFHAANVALLFFIVSAATGALWKSAVVAALFAVHPLHVESVAWIAERKDVLSTFFGMLTLGAYLRYVRRPGWGGYLLVLFLFTLGLAAKPMLITLPLVLLLLDYWPLQRRQLPPFPATIAGRRPCRPGGRRLVLEKAPLLSLSAAAAVVTYLVQEKAGALSARDLYPFWTRVANALDAYVLYLGKIFWPVNLAVFYPHPGLTIPLWQPAAATLLLAALTLSAILTLRRHPYLAVGWFWYLGTLLPVIGVVPIGTQALADRYTYLPLIGLFLSLAWALSAFLRRRLYGPILLAGLTAMIPAVLVPLTRAQLGYWQDSRSLFQRALAVTTGNYLAHGNLGIVYYQEGGIEAAKREFTAALRYAPWYSVARNNLAILLADTGNEAEAWRNLHEILARRPDYAEAHFNLGRLLEKRGAPNQAVLHYEEAIRLKPEFAEAYVNLGSILAGRAKTAAAIANFRKAVEMKPGLFEARFNLGLALEQAGDHGAAAEEYRRALELKPDDAEARRRFESLHPRASP